MKTFLAGVVCAAALLGATASAFAEDAMKPATDKPAEMATMLCRPAMTGEKMTAMTASKDAMVCKKIDAAEMTEMKKKIEAMPGGQPIWLKMFQDYHIGYNGVSG